MGAKSGAMLGVAVAAAAFAIWMGTQEFGDVAWVLWLAAAAATFGAFTTRNSETAEKPATWDAIFDGRDQVVWRRPGTEQQAIDEAGRRGYRATGTGRPMLFERVDS